MRRDLSLQLSLHHLSIDRHQSEQKKVLHSTQLALAFTYRLIVTFKVRFVTDLPSSETIKLWHQQQHFQIR